MTGSEPVHRFLPMGHLYFGADHLRFRTLLGTCVAITLYHPRRKLAGICHFLLPEPPSNARRAANSPGIYATEVLEFFESALRRTNTRAADYVAKIFGGGHMFPDQLTRKECLERACTDAIRRSCASVGCKNVCAARDLLEQYGFSIAAADVGGHGSRQVLFDAASGEVWLRQGAAMASIPAESA